MYKDNKVSYISANRDSMTPDCHRNSFQSKFRNQHSERVSIDSSKNFNKLVTILRVIMNIIYYYCTFKINVTSQCAPNYETLLIIITN